MQFGTIFENSICWNSSASGGSSSRIERDASFAVDAHALPDLLLQEPVAHPHGGLERELLALAHLGVGQLLVVLLQREHAERDVARFVAHHVAQQLLEQRLGR